MINKRNRDETEYCEMDTISFELDEEFSNDMTENHSLAEDQSEDSAMRESSVILQDRMETSSRNSSPQSCDMEENPEIDEENITQTIVYMICVDNMALNATEKEGMRHFMSVLCPLYTPPSRKIIIKLIKQKYFSVQAILKERLKSIERFAISTHIGSVPGSTRSYIVLTLHYIDEKIPGMKTLCLGAKSLSKHYTEANICRRLEEMLGIWGIPKVKIVSAISDIVGVHLMRNTNENKAKQVPCFSTILNSVVTESLRNTQLKDLVEIIEKVNAIATYFKHNKNAQSHLEEEQRKCGKSDETFLSLNPIQEVPKSKWTTTYYCLQKFMLLFGYVEKILLEPGHEKAPHMLTSAEIDLIQETLMLLEPFEQATIETSGEYTSASLIIPLINCLETSLQRMTVNHSVAKILQKELNTQIKKKLDPLHKNIFLATAMILDPRFKKLYFCSPVDELTAVKVVSDEIKDILRSQASSKQSVNSETSGLWSLHEEFVAGQCQNISEIPHELEIYLNQPVIARQEDPIKFWVDNKQAMPGTYQVAMKYLAVLGASVPSEKVVSTINERIRLKPGLVDKLVFLNSLQDEYWEL